jgi:hypothetical protein
VIWSTVLVREPETGNPWRSRGLEWQIPSPPPPGNFARVPVVLSGPYEYGTPGAPPVADLDPPAGAVTAALRAGTSARRRSPAMAGITPDAAITPEAEEAGSTTRPA